MRKAMIGGTGITPFGKFIDTGLRPLAERAVRDALQDAAITANDVDMVFFGNAAGGLLTGQECARGQVALRYTGLLGKPIVNVENACASSSTAFHLAHMAVASGRVEVALAVGVEKLSTEDRTQPIKALESASDLEAVDALTGRISPDRAGNAAVFIAPSPHPAFPPIKLAAIPTPYLLVNFSDFLPPHVPTPKSSLNCPV